MSEKEEIAVLMKNLLDLYQQEDHVVKGGDVEMIFNEFMHKKELRLAGLLLKRILGDENF